MDNKRLIIILMIFTIIFTIMGGTFAYYNWQSADNRKTNVTFTVNRNYTCGADSGGHITSSDIRLAPAKCNDPVYAIKRTIVPSVTATGDKVVSMDLWLNINSIDTNLTNTPNFKWVFSKNVNTCESGIISQGDFRNIQNGKIDLLRGAEYANNENDKYYLYIWLDEAETNTNTMNQSFDFSIGGICNDIGREKATLVGFNWNNRQTGYFKEDDYRTKITDILFIYDEDLPSGITTNNVKTYNLGTSAAKPITGYLIENTDQGANPDTYKLYISSQYRIYSGQLSYTFLNMTALKNIVFNNFDTSATASFNNMFEGCSSLTSINLSNFNMSNAKDMQSTFSGCSSLTELDLSKFNTSKVTNMSNTFSNCTNLVNLDVSSFDTSSVTVMNYMFSSCSSLTSINLSKFNTSNVANMYSMFAGCSSLTELDVSSFDTTITTNMAAMFRGCSSLTTLDLSNFNTSGIISMWWMFDSCKNLINLNVTSFDTSSVTNMEQTFHDCDNLVSLDLSSFNTSNVTTMYATFWECAKLTTIYVSELWNTDAVTSSNSMFAYCPKLVGENGTRYNLNNSNKTYARIDNPPDSPGYFTYKAYTSPSSGS